MLNSDHGLYQCLASNELGTDTFNISLTGRTRPEPPVNLEVAMTEDQRTVQLRVSSVLASLTPRKLCVDLEEPREARQPVSSLIKVSLFQCLF